MQFANCPILEPCPKRSKRGRELHERREHQKNPLLVSQIGECLGFTSSIGSWFFQHDVLAMFQSQPRKLRMTRRRCNDEHNVHVRMHYFVEISHQVNARTSGLNFLPGFLASRADWPQLCQPSWN